MLFPLSDDDRLLHKPSLVTNALLVINVAVFFLLQGMGGGTFTYGWSAVPFELTTGTDLIGPQSLSVGGQSIEIPHAAGPTFIWMTAFSAMFMHGGFAHLGGNMLYLWIFGDNVEHRFGHGPFLAFYLVSGLVATGAQVALNPGSIIPTLGASGAIAGVLGAYLVLFPRNRVNALFFVWLVSVPAVVAIGLWIIAQFTSGWGSLVAPGSSAGGVAYAAHIGGFVAGAVLALMMRMFIKEERPDNVFQRVDPRRKRLW
ncbi:MAG: rhomboid family intramembrane serine protease [Rhodothermales bacterium]|nr:rhomboid family intramembrane serine protease [Rhodothermales bacterium]